ncbi:MAG: lipoate--protein ligase family protein [Desulfuromonadales bacterium]|nr:lipoate--protein ligase family protein [Desulfuromonadales bacterium]NIR32991.1 lipoate--protein ligase family protein [Desulfuromonadales bacterium]NIS40329.1 lipoate--protein ligase family protein [Desulfuromonadales bacterium]
MNKTWRYIKSGALEGDRNMAIDAALFESVASGKSPPVLRLYNWHPPTVTLGYGQREVESVDLDFCRQAGLAVVRRPTGGRAVLHDREVTYAIIASEGTGDFPGGILDNYRVVSEILRDTIRSFDLPAELVPGRSSGGRPSGGDRSVCFTAPSSYELVVDGCKIAGSAQKRGQGAFLQHGSIPLEMDLEKLFRALTPGRTPTAQGVERLRRSVGWLNRYASSALSVRQVEERLVQCFVGRLGCRLVEDQPTATEQARVRELIGGTYRRLV